MQRSDRIKYNTYEFIHKAIKIEAERQKTYAAHG